VRPPAAADLTVVIPTRDRWDLLRRTLDALRAQTVQGFRTLVVVDGTDQVPPHDLPADVLVVEHGGPGAARNRGVEAAGTELVLFLGDDMVPVPGLVAAHLAAHDGDPSTGVLGLVAWHPEVAGDRLARWLDFARHQFDFGSIRDGAPGFGHFYSCNVSLHRSTLLGAGGFDEDFVYYYEDLDLGWRLDRAGVRLRHAPDALTHHLHRYSWSGIERRFTGIARGERLMAVKHPWFSPWFRQRMEWALAAPPETAAWGRVEALLPASTPEPVRRRVRRRADTAYLQRLAPSFLAAWDGERDLEDLRRYLGDRYDPTALVEHRRRVDEEEAAAPDEPTFYRTSEAYLYDLTAFAMSGVKGPYLDAVRRLLPPAASVLDVGCGIGADGLRLLEQGYRVEFADFDNPSTRFLRWRLADRGLSAAVHDVEQGLPDGPDGGYDLAYAWDVVEHLHDPVTFLRDLEQRSRWVAVNLLEPSVDDVHVHHDLDVAGLLARAAARGLVLHRLHHGRSHLVVYRGDLEPAVPRLRSRAELHLGPAVGPRLAAAASLPGLAAARRAARRATRRATRRARGSGAGHVASDGRSHEETR
jgi:GT2 family glycosyltransferase/SAM-dependent methyltransferase